MQLPEDFDTSNMHLISVGGEYIAITPCFTDAERTFKRAVRDSAEDTVEWFKDCPLAGRMVRLGYCDPMEVDPENIYNLPSIRQSIEEDRK